MFNSGIKIILLTFLFAGCSGESCVLEDDRKTNLSIENRLNDNVNNLDSLKSEIISSGDEYAYGELILWDWNHSSDGIFLFDLIMATEYNYVDGYSNAFHSMLRQFEDNGMEYKDLNNDTKKILLYLLKMGAEKGDETAGEMLKTINKNGTL